MKGIGNRQKRVVVPPRPPSPPKGPLLPPKTRKAKKKPVVSRAS